ncbi:hypothetical protein MP228_005490 [Amoeboaphelidium protococcarum]|nr:hypothetical protein MP228_005490 [Amoeboaphelidium protococcarum]
MDKIVDLLEEHSAYVTYTFILLAAVFPIYFGSFASIKYKKVQDTAGGKSTKSSKDESDDEDEDVESEAITSEDAMWFPIIGSGVLFSLYLVFRFFSKEYINYLLTAYFGFLGCLALAKMIDAIGNFTILSSNGLLHLEKLKIRITKHKGKELIFKYSFTYFTIAALVVAILCTAYYVVTKNWIVSNLFGWAFSSSAIQLLDLDDFKTGMLLLSGLFVYDIFWVFGTEVMVSVAKNFDAPIKLLFPRNFAAWARGEKVPFSMLGLGDIVIPGIFVALCLRYDYYRYAASLKNGKGAAITRSFPKPYFIGCMIAYIIGLVTTMAVMHVFQAAQPALLYLSPSCILSVLLVALVRGELSQVFAYKSESASKLLANGSAASGDQKSDKKKK